MCWYCVMGCAMCTTHPHSNTQAQSEVKAVQASWEVQRNNVASAAMAKTDQNVLGCTVNHRCPRLLCPHNPITGRPEKWTTINIFKKGEEDRIKKEWPVKCRMPKVESSFGCQLGSTVGGFAKKLTNNGFKGYTYHHNGKPKSEEEISMITESVSYRRLTDRRLTECESWSKTETEAVPYKLEWPYGTVRNCVDEECLKKVEGIQNEAEQELKKVESDCRAQVPKMPAAKTNLADPNYCITDPETYVENCDMQREMDSITASINNLQRNVDEMCPDAHVHWKGKPCGGEACKEHHKTNKWGR